jgi:hypothetical protein
MKSSDQISLGHNGASSDCIGLIKRFLGATRQIELHGAIYPPDSLVIPCMTLQSQPVIAFPESPTAMLGNHRIERLNHRRIARYKPAFFPVIRRP